MRRRLTAALLIGTGLLVFIDLWGEDQLVRRGWEGQFDSRILAQARALVTLTKTEAEGIELDFDDQAMPQFERAERPDFFQIWIEGDTVLERSRSLHGMDLERRGDRSTEPRFRDVELPDGRHGRSVQIDFYPQIDSADKTILNRDFEPRTLLHSTTPATLVLATDRLDLDRTLDTFQWTAVLMSVVSMTAMAIMFLLVVGGELKPLERLGEAVGRLGVDDLGQRLQLPNSRSELEPLIDKLNDLLARLEGSFQRERRFSSDVAHELRTPVAELRSLAEVARRWPEDRVATAAYFDDIQAISQRMERVIGNLLTLTRCEAGVESLHWETVDVASVVAQSWSRFSGLRTDSDRRLETSIATGSTLETDAAKLRMIVDNLLENAARYCPVGGSISCSYQVDEEGFSLQVKNPAPNLAPGDQERLFDRFWRKDLSRSDGMHSGLGLTLSQALAQEMGYTLAADLRNDLLTVSLSGPTRRA
ncbi:MAG: sensor histidine kinase N-terminal domain-containing protein [Thermoanaerobaculia bacterium]|nr:sensor histidine kinase N-terminal domain-containing protein [Thermoanaerobaculia bacterium]